MFSCLSIASNRLSIPLELVPREWLFGSATGLRPSVGIEFAVHERLFGWQNVNHGIHGTDGKNQNTGNDKPFLVSDFPHSNTLIHDGFRVFRVFRGE